MEFLKADCKKAEGGDTSVLEPQPGFFFGSTERDEWYIRDMEATLKIISRALKFYDKHGSVYYRSSW